jgi:hypothetical protein
LIARRVRSEGRRRSRPEKGKCRHKHKSYPQQDAEHSIGERHQAVRGY